MDLRSGETVWRLKHGPPEIYQPLAENRECEIAIIGGGITGALVAFELVRTGLDCILIDKRDLGGGSTSASTALLLYELDTPLCELAGKIGEQDASACYQVCREAIGKIECLLNELGDCCDFIRRKSFYLAEHDADVSDLKREFEARRKHGMRVDFLQRLEIERLFAFSRPAALLSHDAAEIDVVRFVAALIKAAVQKGLRVYGRTQMAGYDRKAGAFTLRTDAGFQINAATGYESEQYLSRKIGTLKSTYAIATEPIADFSGWPERCLIWNTSKPYLYLRTTTDRRAIIGGEDIDFQDQQLRDALLPAKTAKLADMFRSLFPEIAFELACAWTGTFGETEDSLAYIGEPPEMPGTYFALGYGGNGIAYSVIAAEIIRDAWLGKENTAGRLFRFDR